MKENSDRFTIYSIYMFKGSKHTYPLLASFDRISKLNTDKSQARINSFHFDSGPRT